MDYTTGKRWRAIIADDSALIRDMLRDLLEKANFDVEVTTNGKECWDRLNAIKDTAERDGRPLTDYLQVVISDIEMPAMDGHHLTKRIVITSYSIHYTKLYEFSRRQGSLRHIRNNFV